MSALAVSPDGRLLVSAGQDGALKVWETEGLREVRTITGHGAAVNAAVVTPDGRVVLSASEDKTIRAFRLLDGSQLWEVGLVGPESRVPMAPLRIALSADGARLYATCADASLQTVDVVTGKLIAARRGPAHARAFALGPGGVLALGDDEGRLFLIPAEGTGDPLQLEAHGGKGVLAAVFLDATHLVTSGADREVWLWDLAARKPLRTLLRARDAVHALAVDPSRRRVFAGDWAGRLWAIDADRGEVVAQYEQRGWEMSATGMLAVVPTPAGNAVFAATAGLLARWALGERELRIIARTVYGQLVAALDPKRGLLWVSGDGMLRAIEIETGTVRGHVPIEGVVQALRVSEPADALVVSLAAGAIGVVDLETLTPRTVIPVGFGAGRPMEVSADGRLVATGEMGTTVRLHELVGGAAAGTLDHAGVATACLSFSPDGARLLVGGLQLGAGDLRLVETSTGRELQRFRSQAIPPSPQPFAGIRALDDWPLKAGMEDQYHGCALVGDRVLASASSGPIRVFDAASGELLGSLEGHAGPAEAFLPLADGHLLTGGWDGEVRLWDLASRTSLRVFRGHLGAVTQVLAERDPARFITVGGDATVRTWRMDDEAPELTVVPLALGSAMSGLRGATVVVDRDGFFDFTESDGLAQVHMVQGLNAIPLEQLIEVFYRPGLYATVRGGGEFAKSVDLGETLRLPPRVWLEVPREGDPVVVRAHLRVADGGVAKVVLYQNGRRVAEASPRAGPGEARTIAWPVAPQPGDNHFVVVAYSLDALKSYSEPASMSSHAKTSTERRVFVLAAGVDDYGAGRESPARGGTDAIVDVSRGRLGDLAFARADARAFAERFRGVAPAELVGGEPEVLFDAQATRDGILAAVGRIAARAHDDDTVVLFLAGHGVALPRRIGRVEMRTYYYVPSGYRSLGELERTGLSSDDLIDALGRIPARNVVVLLDTCQSGASSEAFANDIFGALRAFGLESGIRILASAAASKPALELKRLGHGVFTSALLDELACEPPTVKTFDALSRGIETRMGELLGSRNAQNVVVLSGSTPLPLVECRGGPAR
jgi:WD40 repeat protein